MFGLIVRIAIESLIMKLEDWNAPAIFMFILRMLERVNEVVSVQRPNSHFQARVSHDEKAKVPIYRVGQKYFLEIMPLVVVHQKHWWYDGKEEGHLKLAAAEIVTLFIGVRTGNRNGTLSIFPILSHSMSVWPTNATTYAVAWSQIIRTWSRRTCTSFEWGYLDTDLAISDADRSAILKIGTLINIVVLLDVRVRAFVAEDNMAEFTRPGRWVIPKKVFSVGHWHSLSNR